MPTTWSGQPLPTPDLRKPSKRIAVEKADRRAAKDVMRRQVVAKVWLRDKGRCVRCGKKCKGKQETYPTDPDCGEVHEPEGRRTGAHLDVDRCELLCRACHFGGPSGAHAPTAARMRTR